MKKETMTSRERVAATVNGLPVDRIPVHYWINPHAACKMTKEIEPAIKDINDAKNFIFPDVSDDKHYAAIRKLRASRPDKCIYTICFGVQDLPSTQLWKMSQFMMALIDYPDEMKEFQQKIADYHYF